MSRVDSTDAEEVRGLALFSALDDDQLAAVLDSTRVLQLEPGERLFDIGAPARRFFLVQEGQIKLFRLSPDGAEKVIEIIHPGQTFAEAVMFMDPDAGYPVNAEAVEASALLAFDCEVMRSLLRESVETCFRVLSAICRRLRQQVDEIDRLTLHDATFRLASYLLSQIEDDGQNEPRIRLTAPKHVIASRLAIQPETFSRLLARLSRRGLIRVERQSVVLRDIDSLRALTRP